jgi:hypothetical protein
MNGSRFNHMRKQDWWVKSSCAMKDKARMERQLHSIEFFEWCLGSKIVQREINLNITV